MLREIKEDLASMYSLMERMDKHMTSFQAEFNKDNYLNEALYEIDSNGHLQPRANIAMQADQSKMLRQIKITIGPLYPQDITSVVQRFARMKGDTNCQAVTLKSGGKGVALVKSIPFNGRRGKKLPEPTVDDATDTQATPVNQPQLQDQPQQQTAQPDVSSNAMAATPKVTGSLSSKLLNRLRNRNTNNGTNNNGSVLNEISLAQRLAAKVQPQQQVQNTALQAAQTQTIDTQQSAAPSDSLKGTDASIYSWLQGGYMDAVNIIAKNRSYDQSAIAELKNINKIYNKICGEPTSDEKLYGQISQENIINEIGTAIKNGDWANNIPQIVANMGINPANIESIIYGNILSHKNTAIITNICADAGIKPGDPNFPTLVYAPGVWLEKFNRRIVDNPKMRYPIFTPKAISGKGTSLGKGTAGHVQAFATNTNGFQQVIAYDISDTEPADPNDTTDYINGMPGILNSFTGELNNAAIQDKAERMASKEAKLTDAQKELITKAGTDEGKAEIFNDALMSFVSANKKLGSLKFADVANSQNPVADYVQNVVTMANFFVTELGFANPEIIKPMVAVSSFAICHYTIGESAALAVCGYSNYTITPQKLHKEWKENVNNVIKFIDNVINQIQSYLSVICTGESSEDNTQNQKVIAPAVAPSAQPVNESKNNIYSEIEALLEEFMR
jgi:hypothetical protein